MSYMFCVPCRWIPIVVAVADASKKAVDTWCWNQLQIDCVP